MANAHDLLMAQRAAMMGKALPYLRRVAYLESHGTEYIRTGIVPGPGIKCEVEMAIVKEDSSQYGQQGVYSTNGERFEVGSYQGKIWLGLGSGTNGRYFDGVSDVDFHHYVIDSSNNNVSRDSFFWIGKRINELSFDFTLFARINNGYIITPLFFKNKYVKFFKDDWLQMSYIPVLDLSGRPAMYDEVSGQLFYNQGTGEFTWGELET